MLAPIIRYLHNAWPDLSVLVKQDVSLGARQRPPLIKGDRPVTRHLLIDTMTCYKGFRIQKLFTHYKNNL
jgi:hypothetical protein